MLPYREGSASDVVTVVLTRSTFWLRLRVNLAAALRWWPWLGMVASVPAFAVLLMWLAFPFRDSGESPWPWVRGALVLGVSLAGGPLLLVAVLRSIRRSPEEADMPRALAFSAETLVVHDANEVTFDAGWTWLAAAAATPSEIVLTLRRDPIRQIFLRRERIGPTRFEKLRGWLEKNGKLA